MKKLLSIFLTIAMLMSMTTIVSADSGNPFVDVPEDAWYHDEVMKAVDTGIINGKTATEFKPDDLLTYAEAVKLAACMSQVYLHGKVTLTAGTPWYQPYADYCKINNIIIKDYDYNKNATRAGYIEIFANALPDSAFEDINNIPDGSILDVKDNAPYTIYVYKMYRAGIMTGADALHNCKPDDNIKRSEVAAIISRMMDESKRVKFDMPETPVKDEEPEIEEPGKDNLKDDNLDETDKKDDTEKEVETDETKVEVLPGVEYEPPKADVVIKSELSIYKQPEGAEYDEYGAKHEFEVQVFGGEAPYSYQWFYYTGYRNQTAAIEDGDYVKDVTSEALIISVEKENSLLGKQIYCEVTDSSGAKVTTDKIRVYGPFSMPVESYLIVTAAKEYTLVGTVADGILKKGEKVSVIRGDKVIAIGIAKDLQMFNKSLDETSKGDNVGIVFEKEDGAAPGTGDIVVKYQPMHEIDTSDIIN